MIDYKAIKNFLRQKGYSEKTVVLVGAYLGEIEGQALWGKKAVSAGSGFDNPWQDYIDEVLAEPLRQLKALSRDIKRDTAIMLYALSNLEMADLTVKMDLIRRKSRTVLQPQLDGLKAIVGRTLNPASGSSTSGPPKTYDEIEAQKEARRDDNRCLW
ncbi:hypothetical protein N9174_04750 [bacterium]|nr:hypothetical protein [bacterium]